MAAINQVGPVRSSPTLAGWNDIAQTGVSNAIDIGLDILHDEYGQYHPKPGEYYQRNADGSMMQYQLNNQMSSRGQMPPLAIGGDFSLSTLAFIGVGIVAVVAVIGAMKK